MKILIVEDERAIAERIQKGFERIGYSTCWVATCKEAIENARVEEFDCIILDRRLPDSDGLEVCQVLREDGISTPILILSAMSHLDQRVEGLELGADDYLIKPFAMDELRARVQALIRRNSAQQSPSIRIGKLELQPFDRTVHVDGHQVSLSNKEYSLLEYLMRNAGRALDRIQILEHVWGETTIDETNAVDVYINYLRNKIDNKTEKSHIKTIRGFGYKFRNED
ncbi:MAG: response regulator transcription factor [Bacteroidetes bacterium]|nr:response regulator transcription factor [Bacteroidota bacterium]